MARAYRLVMLTGAPRSGTTMMHGLLCSHPQANPYVGEASYLHGLLKAFKAGREQFNLQTTGFFTNLDNFADLYRNLIEQTLQHIWIHLGKPNYLVLKDPAMATNILDFHHLVPDCRFVISMRDPRAVIASFLEVLKRQKGLADVPNVQLDQLDQTIAHICNSYNQIYLPLIKNPNAYAGFTLIQKYEDLLLDQDFSELAHFLQCCPSDFSFERLWQGSENRFAKDSPYYAGLWGKKADTSAIRKFEKKLNRQSLNTILAHCQQAFSTWYGESWL